MLKCRRGPFSNFIYPRAIVGVGDPGEIGDLATNRQLNNNTFYSAQKPCEAPVAKTGKNCRNGLS